ncbi:MAG: elongation factor Ts [Spirochaetaceae bacterium]|nr:MAG: elongation factor Ts [Spirochaetaceae bacterium]
MAEIKATEVKRLRDRTGAGMMDCKKALTDADGDFAKAEKILKELGLAAAAKRGGRATKEGRIFTKITPTRAGILELACETDFVARNTDFVKLGGAALDHILGSNITAVDEKIEAMVQEAAGTIKENLRVRRFSTMEIGDNDCVVEYLHGDTGSIGVLVKITADSPAVTSHDAVKKFAFDCALHVAAFNPSYLNHDAVPSEYVAEQESIFATQAKNMDKPENVIQGIVKGKLKKHLAEICLVDQPFVKDEKKSVGQVTAAVGTEAGGTISVTEFLYFRVGEDEA